MDEEWEYDPYEDRYECGCCACCGCMCDFEEVEDGE